MRDYSTFVAGFLTYLMSKDPEGFKYPVQTQSTADLLPTYDFIVVGAGSAGSVVANRLSENSNWRVLLLESGGQENVFSRTPLMTAAVAFDHQRGFNWDYTTTKQSRTCLISNGLCAYPRGRVLGGTSSINGMIYVRGYRSDYDRWGVANPGWSFKDVLPYFIKLEDNRITGQASHGKKGPLTITRAPYTDEITGALLRGGIEMGWRKEGCHENEESCIQYTQFNMKDGRRWSTSTAYLEPVSGVRKNLHIITGAIVNKILIENKIANGVQFTVNNQSFRARVHNEVILSAGAINSPKILMLSGIGLSNHLKAIGIPVVTDLPVGNNLQDHLSVNAVYQVRNGTSNTIDVMFSGQETYLYNHTGPLTSSGVALLAWNRLNKGAAPIMQYHILPTSFDSISRVSIHSTLVRPLSIGTVRLNTKNPNGQPLIDVNYLNHPQDREMLEKGIKDTMRLMKTRALGEYNPKMILPSQCNYSVSSREVIPCLIKYSSEPIYHPVGTAKMGPKRDGGVVSNELKVYGIQKLRVVDASIAPSIVSGNTNAMAIMIGEKGSDIIKKEYMRRKDIKG